MVKKAAFVKCGGGRSRSNYKYNYQGYEDCAAVTLLAAGGPKDCRWGCLGYGSCIRTCVFEAISVADGLASIDTDKCTSCGVCVPSCPRGLIEMVPVTAKHRVSCNSQDTGKVVRSVCSVGCISCKLCEKACEEGLIKVEGSIAVIDYEKCDNCGKCVEKCPARIIVSYMDEEY
jgi:ferredoxin